MEFQLTVDRYDLLEGLKYFETRRKIRPTKKRATLAFDGRFFSIEALDRVIVCNASGTWPGLATVNANVVVALAVAPPSGDPVIVAYDGERLRIGSMTVGCTWQPVSYTLLEMPSTPDWIEALSLKYRARRSSVLAKGYDLAIEKAEKKLDKLIAKITKQLAPLGVKESDIRSLVDKRFTERYAGRPRRRPSP